MDIAVDFGMSNINDLVIFSDVDDLLTFSDVDDLLTVSDDETCWFSCICSNGVANSSPSFQDSYYQLMPENKLDYFNQSWSYVLPDWGDLLTQEFDYSQYPFALSESYVAASSIANDMDGDECADSAASELERQLRASVMELERNSQALHVAHDDSCQEPQHHRR